MPLDADLLLDRRKLKRRVTLWRFLAVLAVAVLVIAVLPLREDGELLLPTTGAHLARLPVNGIIGDDRRTIEALDRAARDGQVRAVIVAIDSPGGTVAGGEGLHAALRRVAERKPVVATMGGTAASAGYMVALPAARIFARESTVTGSIGVLLQAFDASQLMRVVRDLHDQFVGMVTRGRNLPEARVRELADGRVFTGREALGLGLVDAIGGEAEARAWLAENKGVSATLPIRDIETRGFAERNLRGAMQGILQGILAEWLLVDRVRAVWQPAFLQ